ncbi:MAG TPA: 4-alpha-glucanotransferase, partial [Dissulfurispiraceae bacterium]
PDFERFREEHACWLDDYSLFAVLYQRSGKKHLSQWPADTRDRDDGKLRALKIGLGDHIRREKFLQFVFHKQWIALKEYCNARGVKIIGDIPLYVDYDSADVWVHPEIFKVNEHRRPLVLAGSPPDFFSEKGQLYESPAYNWDAVRSTHYSWWIRRVKHNLKLYDKVRLDQLRGYVKAWEVPYGEESAVNGQWVDVPAYGFFNALYRHIASFPLIAEDLGAVAAETREVMHTYDFPGINVLVFAFGADMPRSSYILHNHARNSVVYTGTHDTNTVAGWFDGADDAEKGRFLEYTGRKDGSDVHWDMIRLAMMSVADTAVIPMQDLLGLGAEARMNNPASPRGNWKWRFLSGQLTRAIKDRLSEMTAIYGRKQ